MLVRFARLAVLPLAACASAIGCFQSGANVDSRNVNGAVVHQSYEAMHDAPSGTTQVFARFRVGAGGTNLVLSPPAGVTANGQPLAERDGMLLAGTLPGKHYGGSVAGFRADHEFAFTGPDGKTYRNRAKIERIDHHPDEPAEFSRAQSRAVRFAGPPLRAGETAGLVIVSDDAGAADRMATANADAPGATTVTVSAAALARLPDGTARMHWVRAWKQPLQQDAGGGGEIAAVYKSKELPVAVTK